MTEVAHQVGDIFEVADYGSYPPRLWFTRAEEVHGITLGPMRRRSQRDAHGRTQYVCEATVTKVLPHADIVGDADDFEGAPVV